MISVSVALVGAATGGGAAAFIAGLLPTTPDLPSALARLSSTTGRPQPDPARSNRSSWSRWSDEHLPAVAARLGLQRYRADLDLLGELPETLALRKLSFGALGLAFPPALTTAMALIGVHLPWVVPGFASLVLAALLFLAPDLDLRRRASATRAEMRRAVCVYLELVALERAADAGTGEALHRAADIGDGRAFALIRDALLRAQLTGTPPWQGLALLAEQVQVTELGDVADIMRLSGQDGAAVYATLRARAGSLRRSLLSAAAAEANAASEHMIMPVAALGVAFMALLGYPAFARILFG